MTFDDLLFLVVIFLVFSSPIFLLGANKMLPFQHRHKLIRLGSRGLVFADIFYFCKTCHKYTFVSLGIGDYDEGIVTGKLERELEKKFHLQRKYQEI